MADLSSWLDELATLLSAEGLRPDCGPDATSYAEGAEALIHAHCRCRVDRDCTKT